MSQPWDNPDEQPDEETGETPTATAAKSENTSLTPGGHESFDLPGDPGLPHCPVCKTGVLYTIAFDPDALHEDQKIDKNGDPKGHEHFVPSGGSIRLKCFNCETTQTQALNPGKAA